MLDGLPLPQTLPQILTAILLAWVGGMGATLAAAVGLLKVYQERGKPDAEIHVSLTQGELNLAQAAKAKADGDAGLMGVAIEMAKASHAELVMKRQEVADKERELKEKEQELTACRDQVRLLEKQLLGK